MLHFLQRKNVVCYTFYNEKMLNVTLFTTKKCDGVEYSGISDNFFDMKNVLNDFLIVFIGRAERLSIALLKKIS